MTLEPLGGHNSFTDRHYQRLTYNTPISAEFKCDMQSTVRIIGGCYRGKKLGFSAHATLRPTPVRIRETLFNWLMHDIREATCLDAFAGSGALGFEAFSRGAAKVTLIEQDPSTYQNLKTTAHSFSTPALTVLQHNSLDYLKKTADSYDIIFLDPPFASDLVSLCVERLEQRTVLKPGGLLYIESAVTPVLNPVIWNCLQLKKAGQVFYGLYRNQ